MDLDGGICCFPKNLDFYLKITKISSYDFLDSVSTNFSEITANLRDLAAMERFANTEEDFDLIGRDIQYCLERNIQIRDGTTAKCFAYDLQYKTKQSFSEKIIDLRKKYPDSKSFIEDMGSIVDCELECFPDIVRSLCSKWAFCNIKQIFASKYCQLTDCVIGSNPYKLFSVKNIPLIFSTKWKEIAEKLRTIKKASKGLIENVDQAYIIYPEYIDQLFVDDSDISYVTFNVGIDDNMCAFLLTENIEIGYIFIKVNYDVDHKLIHKKI